MINFKYVFDFILSLVTIGLAITYVYFMYQDWKYKHDKRNKF